MQSGDLNFTFCVKVISILIYCSSPSHHIFNSALARKLATSGHNVTFLSADLAKNATENLHYIHLEYQYKAVEE
jgi:hypothetical protein